jgi:hypothetical protein
MSGGPEAPCKLGHYCERIAHTFDSQWEEGITI